MASPAMLRAMAAAHSQRPASADSDRAAAGRPPTGTTGAAPAAAGSSRWSGSGGQECRTLLRQIRRTFSVALVLDTSASMNHRWHGVIKGVVRVLNALQADDEFGCVAFNSQVNTVRAVAKGDKHAKLALAKQLLDLRCNGNTALYEALLAGLNDSRATIQRVASSSSGGGRMRLDADDDDNDAGPPSDAVSANQPRHTHYLLVMTDGENTVERVGEGQAKLALQKLSSDPVLALCEFKLLVVGIDVTDSMNEQLQQLTAAGGAHSEYRTVGSSATGPDSIESLFEHSVLVPILTCKVFDADPLWALLRALHISMDFRFLSRQLSLSKPSSLDGFYTCLAQYEAAISSQAQHPDWMLWARKQWQLFMSDRNRYSNEHWASCLYAVEGHILQPAQEEEWFTLGLREQWVQLLKGMGAGPLPFIDPRKVGLTPEQVLAGLFMLLQEADEATTPSSRAQLQSIQRDVYPGPFASLVPDNRVRVVKDGVQDYEAALREAGPRLVVIEYQGRSWCGPCQQGHKPFEQLSIDFPQALFLSVPDARTAPANADLDRVLRIAAYPMYRLMKNRVTLVDKVQPRNTLWQQIHNNI